MDNQLPPSIEQNTGEQPKSRRLLRFSLVVMTRRPARSRVDARRLLLEPLEIRALLATDFGAALEPTLPTSLLEDLASSQERRTAEMKASMNAQQLVGLENEVARELLDVFRRYAEVYKEPNEVEGPAGEMAAAAAAMPEESSLWTQAEQSRVGVRVVITDVGVFSDTLGSLKELGYEEFASDTSYLLSEGSLPVWAIPEASNLAGVAALDAMHKPVMSSGSVLTQADGKLNADDVRSVPRGYTGAGVRLCR